MPHARQPDAAPFPLFLTLEGKRVLVVGDGPEAAAKLRLLRGRGAELQVIAPDRAPGLAVAARECGASYAERMFQDADLGGAALCFVALRSDSATRQVVAAARERNVLVNAVDRPELCDFLVPAIIDRAPVCIAVGTGGLAPALARELRQRIEAAIPSAFGRLASFCGAWRQRVAVALPDPLRRRRFWDAMLGGEAARLVLAGQEAQAGVELAWRLDRADAVGAEPGCVYLVGAGPGDPELLTLKAQRLLQRADVIVHDRLIDPRVLDLARRGARRIDVGKRCGQHAASQAAINALLLREARNGAVVVRLKGGDPFVFGRGGEEMQYLQRAGIGVEVVPGITAACAAAARLGVSLTHREVARGVHLLTGHTQDGGLPYFDWPALACAESTIALYMGRETLRGVAIHLIEAGKVPDTPCVAMQNATLPEERAVRGTLATLPSLLEAAVFDGPTIVLIGDAVGVVPAPQAALTEEAA